MRASTRDFRWFRLAKSTGLGRANWRAVWADVETDGAAFAARSEDRIQRGSTASAALVGPENGRASIAPRLVS